MAQQRLMSFVHLCNMLVRKEHEHKKTSTLDVYKIICENYDDEYNDLLQRQSMMPEEDSTPANPERKSRY